MARQRARWQASSLAEQAQQAREHRAAEFHPVEAIHAQYTESAAGSHEMPRVATPTAPAAPKTAPSSARRPGERHFGARGSQPAPPATARSSAYSSHRAETHRLLSVVQRQHRDRDHRREMQSARGAKDNAFWAQYYRQRYSPRGEVAHDNPFFPAPKTVWLNSPRSPRSPSMNDGYRPQGYGGTAPGGQRY